MDSIPSLPATKSLPLFSVRRVERMDLLPRRQFVEIAAAFTLPPRRFTSGGFRFAHVTDLHIQRELNAAEKCARCMKAVMAAKPDFVVIGGDLVFDVNAVSAERASELFQLYKQAARIITVPAHAVIGNHDLYGIGGNGEPAQFSMESARSRWQTEIGPRFQAFDHGGWRFILLDSIDGRPGGGYRGFIDHSQINWLAADLASHKGIPKVVITHIPLVTGFLQYGDLVGQVPNDGLVVANARELVSSLLQNNVRLVLQGHTHICETVKYGACEFVTTGAVCGNWWKGPRLGFKNGFGLIDVDSDGYQYRYVSYEL